MGPCLTLNFFLENRPKIALYQYWYFGVLYTMCILSVYTLLKVVGYYDLSVLPMSVMGFQKKFGWGFSGWSELYPVFFGFLDLFNFAKPLSPLHSGLRVRLPPENALVACLLQHPPRIPRVHPCSFISVSTLLLPVSLGLPLFPQPSDVHLTATLGRDVVGIRSTWRIHFHLRISLLGW